MDEKAQGHKGMRYAGGKNGAGVYQTIISMIPAHAVYVEAFAGSAAIARRIKPAGRTILMERDPAMADRLRAAMPAATVMGCDAVPELEKLAMQDLAGWFFYLDPPYLHSTRKDLALYKFEMSDDAHRHLWHRCFRRCQQLARCSRCPGTEAPCMTRLQHRWDGRAGTFRR